MRIPRTLALGAAVLALVISACTPGESGSSEEPGGTATGTPEISIGSAGFPEAALVAEIYAQALEANGYSVDRHLELGERPAVRAAFDAGEINLAPDYLGGLAAFLELELTSDADAVHAALLPALEELGQTAFDYSPGTDADGFAVRQETADELGLDHDERPRRGGGRPRVGPRHRLPGESDLWPRTAGRLWHRHQRRSTWRRSRRAAPRSPRH